MSQSLRELGVDLLEDGQEERALAILAEAVRRAPEDHRARMMAARCLEKLGEKERAANTLHACAEGLLRRDYLLSAIAACKLALELTPNERRLKETLVRIHSRAARDVPGRARVPPPLPPQALYEGHVPEDLMGLQGEELRNKAIEVLAAPDPGGAADPHERPPLPLFADLDLGAFIDLVGRMGYHTANPGQEITREGEGGEAIWMVVAGRCEVSRRVDGEARALGFLGGGSIFGEIALLTGAPPTATVSAADETELFVIRREALNAVARAHPSVPHVLAEFAQSRMSRNLMATSPLFQQVPEAERAQILGRFSFRAMQPNEKALVEGEHSPGLFLVLAGELVVQKDDPAGGSPVTLGLLREGDVAGEISLLTGLRATATVVATRKTATAFLGREACEALLKEHPETRTYLETLSSRRLKQIGDALRPSEILDADELVVEGDSARSAVG
jgi:CRP-like cAMP-binding protein